MSKIKLFFSKKKEEAAFKLKLAGSLGQGHTLHAQKEDASSSSHKLSADAYVPLERKELSNEVRAAAAAAFSRKEKMNLNEFNTSVSNIKAQAKKELATEQKIKEDITSYPENNSNSNLYCQDIFFRCPVISEEIMSEKDWESKIKDFLYQELETENALSSCLIIQNCNCKEKAEECINTLSKYLENIIKFPEEEKYYKIRMSNRIFCEKVRHVEGALHFLRAVGFREVDIDNETFLIWSKENVKKDYDLKIILEALQNSKPIKLELDRNIKVLLPSQAKHFDLPWDFYQIFPEEIKREQHLRAEVNENAKILKTKAMREREEQRKSKIYKYSLIRVKFPNGIYIQATFGIHEKLSDIFEFVQSCLQDEALEFQLVASSAGKIGKEDMDKTLYDLRSKTTNKVQMQHLLSLMEANTDVACGFHKGSKEALARFWQRAENELNSMGPPTKCVAEWKKVWADQKKYVRQKAAQNLKNKKCTGGGPNNEQMFSRTEEAIYNLIGMKTSVEGVPVKSFGLTDTSITEEMPNLQENISCMDVSFDIEQDTENAVENMTTPVVNTESSNRKKNTFSEKNPLKSSYDALQAEIVVQKELLETIKILVLNQKNQTDLQQKHFKEMERLKQKEIEEMQRHNTFMEKLRVKEIEYKMGKNRLE